MKTNYSLTLALLFLSTLLNAQEPVPTDAIGQQAAALEAELGKFKDTTPEAADGGPLAVVQNGDMIELNVPERRMQLLISDEELKARLAKWVRPEPPLKSGYWKLYVDTVLQADEGCDLDFLVGKRGSFVPKDNH